MAYMNIVFKMTVIKSDQSYALNRCVERKLYVNVNYSKIKVTFALATTVI